MQIRVNKGVKYRYAYCGSADMLVEYVFKKTMILDTVRRVKNSWEVNDPEAQKYYKLRLRRGEYAWVLKENVTPIK